MRICAMMLVRNEDWILGCSIRAALQWCDFVSILDDDSTDDAYGIFKEAQVEFPERVIYRKHNRTAGEHWIEMDLRQQLLQNARLTGATHFAIVDADEILTANLDDKIRPEFEKLRPGECLEVPMLAMRALDVYQDDDSVWSRAWLTLGFAYKPELNWKAADDGYQHHSRAPRGHIGSNRFLTDKAQGGAMHLQWCNRRRIVAKHWLYAYMDSLLWPTRETPRQLSEKYSQALQRPVNLGAVPLEWWERRLKGAIKLDGVPWQEEELRRVLAEYGEERFRDIRLVQERPV